MLDYLPRSAYNIRVEMISKGDDEDSRKRGEVSASRGG